MEEFPGVSWLIPWQGLDIPRRPFLWARVPPASEARNKGNLEEPVSRLDPATVGVRGEGGWIKGTHILPLSWEASGQLKALH